MKDRSWPCLEETTEVLHLSPVVLSNTRRSRSLQMQTVAGRRLVMDLWTDQGAYSWTLIQLSTRWIITSLTKPDWLLYISCLPLFILHCLHLPPTQSCSITPTSISSSCYVAITLASSRFFCTSLAVSCWGRLVFWWALTFEPVTTPDMSDTASTVNCTSLPIMNLYVPSGHHFDNRVLEINFSTKCTSCTFNQRMNENIAGLGTSWLRRTSLYNLESTTTFQSIRTRLSLMTEPTSSNHRTSYLAGWGGGAYFMSG